MEPFGDDKEVHPSEENPEEDNLSAELKNEVIRLFEVNGVECLHENSDRHLTNSEDNRNLHFQTVGVGKIVGGLGPSGVNSKGIHTVGFLDPHVLRLRITGIDGDRFSWIARSEPFKWQCEELIVDQSIEHGEEAH